MPNPIRTVKVQLPGGDVRTVRCRQSARSVHALLGAYLPVAGRFGALQRASDASGVPYHSAYNLLRALGLYVPTGRGRTTGCRPSSTTPPPEVVASGPLPRADPRAVPLGGVVVATMPEPRAKLHRWGRTVRTELPYGQARRLCDAYEAAVAARHADPIGEAARAARLDERRARRLLARLGVKS